MDVLKKYRKLIIILFLIGVIVAGVLMYGNKNGPIRDIVGKIYSIIDLEENEDHRSNYQKTVDLLFKENDTIIYLYGDDLKFEETHYENKNYSDEVDLKKIKSITKEIIRPSDEFNILIFNNLSGKNELSDDELKIIAEATRNNNFTFYYIGDKLMDKFIKYDIFSKTTHQPEDICIASVYEDGERTRMSGIYNETDDAIVNGGVKYSGLDDYILIDIEMRYRSDN